MARQFAPSVLNAVAQAYETAIGASPKLGIFTGAPPASIAAAQSGTLLDLIQLPADWLSNPSGGVASSIGTWSANATNGGVGGYYRLFLNDGVTVVEQGTVGTTGSGADLELSNTTIAAGAFGDDHHDQDRHAQLIDQRHQQLRPRAGSIPVRGHCT